MTIFRWGNFSTRALCCVAIRHPHTNTSKPCLQFVEEGKVALDDIITHRLSLTDIAKGYDLFKNKKDNCVKVVLDPWAG